MRTLSDMPSVAVAVTEGVTIFEVAVPCDVFGVDRSDIADPWYDLVVCAPQDVHFGGWFRAETPHGLDELVAADTVIVPACRSVHEPPPADLVEAVRAAHERGARVASICSGAFVLAAAGLLDGRRATTHWLHAALLAEQYPDVEVDPGVLYIDDGNILTSAGKAAGIDLCLHMVEPTTAAQWPTPWPAGWSCRRIGRRAGPVHSHAAVDKRRRGLAGVLAWAIAHLDQPLLSKIWRDART